MWSLNTHPHFPQRVLPNMLLLWLCLSRCCVNVCICSSVCHSSKSNSHSPATQFSVALVPPIILLAGQQERMPLLWNMVMTCFMPRRQQCICCLPDIYLLPRPGAIYNCIWYCIVIGYRVILLLLLVRLVRSAGFAVGFVASVYWKAEHIQQTSMFKISRSLTVVLLSSSALFCIYSERNINVQNWGDAVSLWKLLSGPLFKMFVCVCFIWEQK